MARVIMCDSCKEVVKHDYIHPVTVTDIRNNKTKTFEVCTKCYKKLITLLDWKYEEENTNGN